MESTVKLITAPAPDQEPISLEEAKAHLRLETSEDDNQVLAAIAGARQLAEEFCWRGFVTQTWELLSSCFPDETGSRAYLELPKGNLVSVESVKYVDDDGAEQTLDPSVYSVDTASEPGRLRLAYGESWPGHRSQWDAVRVRYVVGWSKAAVPAAIKSALLLLTAQLYENRVPEVTGTIVSKLSIAHENLLRPFRLARF